MKNFASSRALALLFCASCTVLSLAHNASAVAGAPALPNLNFTNVGPLGTPSGQSYFNPLLVNLTQILNQPGANTLQLGQPGQPAQAPFAAQPAALAGQSFPPGHQWAQAPVVKVLTPHNFAPTSGDLNHFVRQTNVIRYPTLNVPTQNADGTPEWNGQGALPNAFQAPWHFSATNFDPTFRTPYWNEKSGFTSDSFELGLANTDYGQNIFNRGLAYAGKSDYSQDLPVWGGSASDVTRALFPSSLASSRAGVAL
jgi:hypothetical protein